MTTPLASPQAHRAPRRHAGTSAAGHMLLALLARIERGSIELVAPDDTLFDHMLAELGRRGVTFHEKIENA